MRLLAAAWRETGRSVRRLCLVMWCAGVAAVVLGVFGETRGWWVDRAFLADLASSATSALFGVPVALVVIQYVIARQSDDRARREAEHEAAQLSRELVDDTRKLVSVEATPQAVAALRVALRVARETVEQLSRGHHAEAAAVGRAYALWNETVAPRTSTERLIGRIRTSWRSLKDEARPKLMRAGVPWLDRELVDLMDETLTDGLSAGGDRYWMEEFRLIEGELNLSRLHLPGESDLHLRRLERAETHLRSSERAVRYAEEVYRHFAEMLRHRAL